MLKYKADGAVLNTWCIAYFSDDNEWIQTKDGHFTCKAIIYKYGSNWIMRDYCMWNSISCYPTKKSVDYCLVKKAIMHSTQYTYTILS